MIEYDTFGNLIPKPQFDCDCGLTGGCELCNPMLQVNSLDEYLKSTADDLITIEEARKITDKLPSLTKIFLEGK